MEVDAIRHKRGPIPALLVAACIVASGILFVHAFTLSWRAVALFPLAAAFLLGCAFFIYRLRDFLLFSLMFALPLGIGYHVVFDPAALAGGSYRAGIVINVVDVLLLVLYAGWIFNGVVFKQQIGQLSFGGTIGVLSVFWILYLLSISMFVSDRFDYSLYLVVEVFKAFLLFFYLVNNINSVRDLRIVIYGLIANTVTHAMYICFQYVTHLNYTLHGELSHHYVPIEGFRPVGFTGSWDEAAILLAIVLTVIVAHSLIVAKRVTRVIDFLLIVMVVVGLLLTKMRSSWIAASVSIPIVIAVSYIRGRISSGFLVKVFVVLVALTIIAGPFMVQRFITGTHGENRMPLMITAINMFEDNWLTGVGAGNYLVHVHKYIPQELRNAWVSTVHNEYLLRLAESGVFGFLLYYLIFIIALRKLWLATRSSNPWVFAVSIGFFAAMIGSIPNRFLSVYHFPSTFSLYTVILALACQMENIDQVGE